MNFVNDLFMNNYLLIYFLVFYGSCDLWLKLEL